MRYSHPLHAAVCTMGTDCLDHPSCSRRTQFGKTTAERCPRSIVAYSQGFIYPSLHAIWSKWAPKHDKSKLATFAFSGKFMRRGEVQPLTFVHLGSYIGTLVAMMFGGLIAVHWSWEWIFYLSGTVRLVFFFLPPPDASSRQVSRESFGLCAGFISWRNRRRPIRRSPKKKPRTSMLIYSIRCRE